MRTRARLTASFVVTVAAAACGSPRTPEAGGTPTHVEHHPNGTCTKQEATPCPPDALCNPPAPQEVDCESGEPTQTELAPQPSPSEQAPKPEPVPPPEPVKEPVEEPSGERPGGATDLPKPRPGANVVRRADNTCWESYEAHCPPHARCNPPPPRQVECP